MGKSIFNIAYGMVIFKTPQYIIYVYNEHSLKLKQDIHLQWNPWLLSMILVCFGPEQFNASHWLRNVCIIIYSYKGQYLVSRNIDWYTYLLTINSLYL